MSDLKTQLVKLGALNPELRPHIREVLKVAGLTTGVKDHGLIKSVKKMIEDVGDKAEKALARYEDLRLNQHGLGREDTERLKAEYDEPIKDLEEILYRLDTAYDVLNATRKLKRMNLKIPD